jgi:hypothetical protein
MALRSARPLVLVAALGAALAGCGDGGDSAACLEVREIEDPQSSLHLIDDEGLTYLTDPPTSGPHIAVLSPEGLQTRPLADPLQVRVLETGHALIQFEGVDAATEAALAGLASPSVVVAPGEGLPEPIVATAWTWKLTCSELDVDALARFAAERPAAAPGAD